MNTSFELGRNSCIIVLGFRKLAAELAAHRAQFTDIWGGLHHENTETFVGQWLVRLGSFRF